MISHVFHELACVEIKVQAPFNFWWSRSERGAARSTVESVQRDVVPEFELT